MTLFHLKNRKKKNKEKKKKKEAQDFGVNRKCYKICKTGVPESEDSDKGTEEILEEKMAETSQI